MTARECDDRIILTGEQLPIRLAVALDEQRARFTPDEVATEEVGFVAQVAGLRVSFAMLALLALLAVALAPVLRITPKR